MCKYCDKDSAENMFFQDWVDNEWYMEVATSQWDDYDDDWIYERVYGVEYCPFCGNILGNKYENIYDILNSVKAANNTDTVYIIPTANGKPVKFAFVGGTNNDTNVI